MLPLVTTKSVVDSYLAPVSNSTGMTMVDQNLADLDLEDLGPIGW